MERDTLKVLDSLVTDGGEQHPRELASNAERGLSTIYRVLDRLKGIVHNENATVSFASKKIEQEIAAIIESTEHQIENAADRVAELFNMETRQAASSAWQQFCNKYAAKMTNEIDDDKQTLRIDTMLSEFRSSSLPYLPDVLNEALTAWHAVGRDPIELRHSRLKWRDKNGDWQNGVMGPNLR